MRDGSRWYRHFIQESSLFFISLFRIHLNNTTSCCERAKSREKPPARPGTREFWDRPRTHSYCCTGERARSMGNDSGIGTDNSPRNDVQRRLVCVPRCVPITFLPYKLALSFSQAHTRHFSNFSLQLLRAKVQGFSQVTCILKTSFIAV